MLGFAGDPRAQACIQVIMVNEAEREAALYEWVASLYESNRRIWALFDAQKNGLFAGADNTGNSSQTNRTAGWVYEGESINGVGEACHSFRVDIPTSNGGWLSIPTTVEQSGIPDGNNAFDVINKFVEGINDILTADPTYFDILYDRDISVVITHENNIKYEGQGGMVGLHTSLGGKAHKIMFSGNALMGKMAGATFRVNLDRWPMDQPGKPMIRESARIIAHEFAHARQATMAGSNYHNLSFKLREYYAITESNAIMNALNRPQEHNPNSPWLGVSVFQFLFPGTWGKYSPKN